jgi:murein DD-endopeptidase MepM/ murein hydrolase activator NlpD
VKKGTRVEQGDVIGYVGATGLATGPHLDYRVRDGGVWMNPLKLKSITPDPLRGSAMNQFRASVAQSSGKLESSLTRLASNQEIRRALF